VVDDNKEFCLVFAEALNDSGDVICTRYFHHGSEAIDALLSEFEIPSVILLDINMPGMNGMDALRSIKQIEPEMRIIMLTVNDREENIRQAIELGASGYLLKTSSVNEVTRAVHAVMHGGVPMDPVVIKKMLTMFALNPQSVLKYRLSAIEKEIIRHTSLGKTTIEIAEQMRVSPHTIKTRLKGLFHKLDVHTRAQLTAKATKENLI